jgi:hypothetical protein
LRINDQANDTTPFIVDANGSVGIGTAAPTHILHIAGQGRSTSSAWATSSDRRIKTNIAPLDDSLNTIMHLNPVSFEYIDDYKTANPGLHGLQRGFIAQEVERVIPEMVKIVDEKFGDQQISDFRLLTNGDLVPVLVKAVQELKAQNDQLRNEFEAYTAEHP